MVAVDHGRVADLSDSADEAPPAPATPKAKAKAKAKAPATPKKPTSGGISSPRAASKSKSPAVPKMKKPAARLKRPASAMSAAEDVNGDDASIHVPAETTDPNDGNSAPGKGAEDPDVCKKPAAATRKNKKAADFGLDPITHVKHNGQDYFNMRYVAKGRVSIRNDSKLVVFTVS